MGDLEGRPTAVKHSVNLLVPVLERPDEVALAMHRADRRLGVIRGGRAGRARFGLLLTDVPDEEVVALATGKLEAALRELGLDGHARAIEVEGVERRVRPVPEGQARAKPAPAGLEYRTVALPDGRRLCVHHAGPLGDWIVFVEGEPEAAWAGYSLMGVLTELFDLPFGKRAGWVHELVAELAGHDTPWGTRYACPCCDQLTLDEPPPGTFSICPVCWWEDDNIQFTDPDYRGGANKPSLREARARYAETGVSEARLEEHARAPAPEETPPP